MYVCMSVCVYVCMRACMHGFVYTAWTHVSTEPSNWWAEAELAPCGPRASLIDPGVNQLAEASVPQ